MHGKREGVQITIACSHLDTVHIRHTEGVGHSQRECCLLGLADVRVEYFACAHVAS